MKNNFEKNFYESRDTWWSIQNLIEKHADQKVARELKHIMELSLYNQRDMLIEIDKLKAKIDVQNRPQLQKRIEEPKKREVRLLDNPILEKMDYFLYKLRS